MKWFKPEKRRQHRAPDLSSPPGRARAERELILEDHGFLREHFQNLHRISPEMWRSNQPNPTQIKKHARLRGIRTIINLRGPSTRGYYLLEQEACKAAGIDLVDFQLFSRDVPSTETVLAARDLFSTITYPALMHCKSGADRAGMMAALYMIFRQKQPVTHAIRQLSKRYLHIREGRTGLLDAFFHAYLDTAKNQDIAFETWLTDLYDPQHTKTTFLQSGRSRLGLDRILRRE